MKVKVYKCIDELMYVIVRFLYILGKINVNRKVKKSVKSLVLEKDNFFKYILGVLLSNNIVFFYYVFLYGN